EGGEPVFGLGGRARVLPVHVDAIRASVELRRAQLDQVEQRVLEAAFRDVALEREHRAVGVGGGLGEVEAWFHAPSLGFFPSRIGRPCRPVERLPPSAQGTYWLADGGAGVSSRVPPG